MCGWFYSEFVRIVRIKPLTHKSLSRPPVDFKALIQRKIQVVIHLLIAMTVNYAISIMVYVNLVQAILAKIVSSQLMRQSENAE